MTHEEIALEYFNNKYHCSQAVLVAYAKELGLTKEQALKISYCFNSGMRKAEVCGACSGALMVLGMKYGQYQKDNLKSREKANNITDRFLDTFKKENGSYICKDLLGCDISKEEGLIKAIEKDCFSTTCPKLVKSAVNIIDNIDNNKIIIKKINN